MRSLTMMNPKWDIGHPSIGILRCNISRILCPRIAQRHSRVVSLIRIMHSRLNHMWKDLHMNRRTLVFELLLNKHLSSHRCKAQKISIDKFLNFGLENMTNFYRMPYVSSMVSTRGIRVVLTAVGKLSRLDLFR